MRRMNRVLLLVTACNRQPAEPGVDTPVQVEPALATGGPKDGPGGAEPVAGVPTKSASPTSHDAGAAVTLAPQEGLTKVEPLRPGPDEVDVALLLRLRRHSDAALKIEAIVRSGDAWLVAYTYDEVDAWWRGVHREGKAAEVRAELRRRRLACEAAYRHPEEASTGATGDDGVSADHGSDDFDPGPENGMDDRSCWDRALASLAPRQGPIEGDCLALSVARVTAAAIEDLWSFEGACVEAPADFELADVAGAGWPQLVLQVRATRWDMTRLGFQRADTTERLIVIDPRKAADPLMLEQVVSYETHVDESWHWEGSYAHVDFKRGRHVTVLEQEWKTSDGCTIDEAGWAVADEGDEGDTFEPCTVEWTMTRTRWDPATQRWSGKAETVPPPKRPPPRDGEPPFTISGARPGRDPE